MANYHTQILYDQFYKDDENFKSFVENRLKENFIDLILSEVENGEKILHLGKPYFRNVPELCQVESRLDLTMEDLIRCKDCVQYYVPKPIKWAKRDAEGNFIGYELIQDPAICCEFDCETDPDGYCHKAERKEKNEDARWPSATIQS